MADETVTDIAYEHAKQNLAVQRVVLDNFRARAGTLITAAAVIASFLGGQALADTSLPRGATSPVPDRSLELWEGVAFAAFLALLALCASVLRPKAKGWTFRLNAKKVLALGGEADTGEAVQAYKRQLVGHLEDYHEANEAALDRLSWRLRASVILLGVEAFAFLLDLIT